MKKSRKLSLLIAILMLFSSFSFGLSFAESYQIRQGDTLSEIAESYGLNWNDLAEYNNLKNPDLIIEGDVLQIPDENEAGNAVDITVLATADMHGRIYPYEYAIDSVDSDAGLLKIQTLVKEERANNENVILMDSGDLTQDNSAELFNKNLVHSMIKAVNYMGYDLWTLGNHQFNFEKSFTDGNIADFWGTTLAANIYNEDGTRYVDPYKIFDFNGVKVAIVGMTTPYVPIWEAAAPSHFEGLTFTPTVAEAKKVLNELEGKYDVLIGSFHLGQDGEHGYEGAAAIAEACPEFDVIFMAHSHSKVNNVEVNGVKLIEPGKYGWALAKADISVVKDGEDWVVDSIETNNLQTKTVEADADMAKVFKYVDEISKADANIVVGEVTEDFITGVDYITGESHVTTMPRSQVEDTALLDLINEVQMFYSDSDISSAATFTNDMNLVKGDFKKKDVAYIYKYPNTLMGVNITGENLKKYMEWSASYFNTYQPGDLTISFNQDIRGYNYDMFAGVDYKIDISEEPGKRITNLTLNGNEIVDSQVYKLAVNNYRFGTLLGLGLVTPEDKYYDSYAEMQDAGRIRSLIVKYITEEKDGLATPNLVKNWEIVGTDFDRPLKDEVYQMIIDGDITIPTSEDGRTPNVAAVNMGDLIEDGYFNDEYELTIVHTNDVHGFYIEGKYDGMGAAKIDAYTDVVKAENPNTLFVDAGDALQGNNLVTLSKGEYGVDILNSLEYDVMVAGNHEFDYGSDRLLELEEMLEFPLISANITVDADGTSLFTPYIIKQMDGFKVGIFGITTPETVYKSHPDNTVGLTFEDPITVGNEMVAELEGQVDVIIALVHLGVEGDYSSIKFAEAVDGVDLIIDGHSHTDLDYGLEVNGTLIVQAGEKSKNVGVVKFDIENKDVVDVEAYQYDKSESSNGAEDQDMLELVTELKALNAIIEDEIVAYSPIVLNGERAFVRTGETNLGNMLTEALLDISGADIAFSNGGGIRTSINIGDVTKGEILNVLPFGNTVRVIELSGADVIAAIENGISDYPDAKGAFPHIAGMTVKFDSTKAAGERVVEIKVNGTLIDENATYTMATNDFLVAGGDGYKMFKGKTVVAEYGAMDEILIDYMANTGFDKAVITGRIMDIN
ncbi:MAG: 5'-nucleotidase C-terminal domain-containing protein [Clostridiales bacterium]|nr:5'-nucleotidase C-terminal domain-containing protein [Clostridiales bacterium]